MNSNRVLIAAAAGLAAGFVISAFGGPACFAVVSVLEPTGNALGERDSHDGNPIGGLSSDRKRRIRRCRNGRAHRLACSPDLRRPARGVATPRRARRRLYSLRSFPLMLLRQGRLGRAVAQQPRSSPKASVSYPRSANGSWSLCLPIRFGRRQTGACSRLWSSCSCLHSPAHAPIPAFDNRWFASSRLSARQCWCWFAGSLLSLP